MPLLRGRQRDVQAVSELRVEQAPQDAIGELTALAPQPRKNLGLENFCGIYIDQLPHSLFLLSEVAGVSFVLFQLGEEQPPHCRRVVQGQVLRHHALRKRLSRSEGRPRGTRTRTHTRSRTDRVHSPRRHHSRFSGALATHHHNHSEHQQAAHAAHHTTDDGVTLAVIFFLG